MSTVLSILSTVFTNCSMTATKELSTVFKRLEDSIFFLRRNYWNWQLRTDGPQIFPVIKLVYQQQRKVSVRLSEATNKCQSGLTLSFFRKIRILTLKRWRSNCFMVSSNVTQFSCPRVAWRFVIVLRCLFTCCPHEIAVGSFAVNRLNVLKFPSSCSQNTTFRILQSFDSFT